jgi:DNA-binding SARP family transcriptional activator
MDNCQMMDLHWPYPGGETATNNQRRTLSFARRTLRPDPLTTPQCLTSRREQLSLCPEEELWVDVEAFEEAAAAARRSRKPAAYRAALNLYAGELLPEDHYEEWAQSRRKRLRGLRLSLLVEPEQMHEVRDEPGPGVAALRRAVSPTRSPRRRTWV